MLISLPFVLCLRHKLIQYECLFLNLIINSFAYAASKMFLFRTLKNFFPGTKMLANANRENELFKHISSKFLKLLKTLIVS